jgi:hypothetical protein
VTPSHCIVLFALGLSLGCERAPATRAAATHVVTEAKRADFEADSVLHALSRDTTAVFLPPSRFTDSLLVELEYAEGATPAGLEVDLNGDRVPEWIVRSSDRLCGNAGCMLVVVTQDERGQLRVVGNEFAGITYVMRRQENGWNVVWVFNSGSGGESGIGRLVYDGTRYEYSATAQLDKAAYAAWRPALSRPFEAH